MASADKDTCRTRISALAAGATSAPFEDTNGRFRC